MSRSNMPRTMQSASPGSQPEIGSGGLTGSTQQMPLFGATEADRIEEVYGALREAVEAFGGATAFAAHAEQPVPKVSMRLRRADDGKGTRQLAPIDYLGLIASDRDARATFLASLCEAWGFMAPEPRRVLTADEKLRIVAGELPERRRRALEREHGLPAGSLEP